MHKHKPAALLLLSLPCLLFAQCKKAIKSGAGSYIELLDKRYETGTGGTGERPNLIQLERNTYRHRENQGPIVVRVIRKNFRAGRVSVDFFTSGAKYGALALAGVDYTPVEGTLVWEADDRDPKIISIPVADDGFAESEEHFLLDLSNLQGGEFGYRRAVCYLTDPEVLSANTAQLSASKGGVQQLSLRAGLEHAGRGYLVASSLGTTGFQLGGVHVPLDLGPLLDLSLSTANGAVFQSTRAKLDGQGRATARFVLPAMNKPELVGLKIYHAFVIHDTSGSILMASNAVELRVEE